MPEIRSKFNSRFAAIMAMAGSAVGLGNIWRFPYMVGEHGGAAFIIVYMACCLLVSLPIFFAEATLGKTLHGRSSETTGKVAPLAAVASFIILSYYCVVGGWSFDYLIRSFAGSFSGKTFAEAREVFSFMSASPVESISCTLVFLGMTSMIVVAGVDKGIGRFSKITIPLLFLMMVAIAVVSISLPGAGRGIEYLVKPDFSKLDGPAVAAALGQSFYSLSLGVGSILTYASYMKEDESIVSAGCWTALFDTLFALIAGFAIMPAVFAAGIEPASGPSLVFETLPVIFSRMGLVLPVLFFSSILLAALSSSISLLEVVVGWLVRRFGMRRRYAVFAVFFSSAVLGAACAVLPNVFSTCDFLASNVFMMLGAFAFAVIAGWILPRETVLRHVRYRFVYALIRYVAPLMIVAIAITNLL